MLNACSEPQARGEGILNHEADLVLHGDCTYIQRDS